MAVVTGIRALGPVVEISADGYVFTRVRKQYFEKLPLQIHEAFDEEEYTDRLAALQAHDAYEAALTLLDASQKSAAMLKKKLLLKGYIEPAAENAVQHLLANHLLDDNAYANRMVENSVNKPIGIFAMKQKLRAKGLSDDVIEEALEQIDDKQQIEQCKKLAEKYRAKYADEPDRRKAKAKLSQALARRGFSWSVISSVLEE